MQPVRKITSATHFKLIYGPETDFQKVLGGRWPKWTPCSPGDPAAIEKSWSDLESDELLEPAMVLGDFIQAFSKIKSTVSPADLLEYDQWTHEHRAVKMDEVQEGPALAAEAMRDVSLATENKHTVTPTNENWNETSPSPAIQSASPVETVIRSDKSLSIENNTKESPETKVQYKTAPMTDGNTEIQTNTIESPSKEIESSSVLPSFLGRNNQKAPVFAPPTPENSKETKPVTEAHRKSISEGAVLLPEASLKMGIREPVKPVVEVQKETKPAAESTTVDEAKLNKPSKTGTITTSVPASYLDLDEEDEVMPVRALSAANQKETMPLTSALQDPSILPKATPALVIRRPTIPTVEAPEYTPPVTLVNQTNPHSKEIEPARTPAPYLHEEDIIIPEDGTTKIKAGHKKSLLKRVVGKLSTGHKSKSKAKV
jgi:hypothetical protein